MKLRLQLQARDLRLFAELARYGLLDTEQVHARHFGDVSRRRCQQRLQQYHDHGLMRRVSLNVAFTPRQGGGHIAAIHCLTERGLESIEHLEGPTPRRCLRSEPQPETLHHRLAVVNVRLAMDDAAHHLNLREPEWLMEQDRRLDAKPDEPPSRQRVLYHEFSSGNKKFTCQPDAASLCWIPRQPDQPQADVTPLLGFWEVDRSTERTKQVLNKCPGYGALLERRDYRRYWPQAEQAAVRVFWVCRSAQRIESLCEALCKQSISTCFRFTTAHELTPATAFTQPIWQTIDGERREILRLPRQQTAAAATGGRDAPHWPPHKGP